MNIFEYLLTYYRNMADMAFYFLLFIWVRVKTENLKLWRWWNQGTERLNESSLIRQLITTWEIGLALFFSLKDWFTGQIILYTFFNDFTYHFEKYFDFLVRYTKNGSSQKYFWLFPSIIYIHWCYSYLDENWYIVFALFMKIPRISQTG